MAWKRYFDTAIRSDVADVDLELFGACLFVILIITICLILCFGKEHVGVFFYRRVYNDECSTTEETEETAETPDNPSCQPPVPPSYHGFYPYVPPTPYYQPIVYNQPGVNYYPPVESTDDPTDGHEEDSGMPPEGDWASPRITA